MAQSEVQICNRALQMLGAERILSLSDRSVNARACSAAYDSCRRRELEDHIWIFATKRFSLAADGTAPEWGKQNAFTLPDDFVRLAPQYPESNFNDKDWEIEGRKIFSNNSAPLEGRYIYDIQDPAVFSPLFCEALSARMAVEMCEELTQSNPKKVGVKDDYNLVIARARKSNAIQRIPAKSPDATWITARQ